MSVKLHLGAGKRYLPGWQHQDISQWPHIDYVGSADDLSRFEDGSVEALYASHLLEYFSLPECGVVLKEWHRVLKKSEKEGEKSEGGGRLYLAVPDLDALILIYNQTGDLGKIIGPLFGRMESDLGMIYHKTVFNKDTLEALLVEAGFSKVSEYDPVAFLGSIDSEFDDHSLAFYPHMDRTGVQVSLCLVASP